MEMVLFGMDRNNAMMATNKMGMDAPSHVLLNNAEIQGLILKRNVMMEIKWILMNA